MIEQDYVLRLVRQLGQVVARMVGLRQKQQEEEVVRQADSAAGDLLGLPPGAFDRLDGRTLAALLKDAALVRGVAELLDEEAAAHEALGRTETAARRRALAADLRAS
jgi:hypothetical protein